MDNSATYSQETKEAGKGIKIAHAVYPATGRSPPGAGNQVLEPYIHHCVLKPRSFRNDPYSPGCFRTFPPAAAACVATALQAREHDTRGRSSRVSRGLIHRNRNAGRIDKLSVSRHVHGNRGEGESQGTDRRRPRQRLTTEGKDWDAEREVTTWEKPHLSFKFRLWNLKTKLQACLGRYHR